ncbi:MAG TPA: hypothetical protein VMH22_14370 [bacterium]|nr:hypothetical protein [bacterium]
METSSGPEEMLESPLLAEMDRVIDGIAQRDRKGAYAALEAVFEGLKAGYERLSEAEISEFAELVHLVLLQFARGATIRVSGSKQHRELDVCLKYNDVYEAALSRAMEFLSRNLIDHIEKYSPQQYLRAALRVLGKEYHQVLTESYHTDSIPEESAASSEDEENAVAAAPEEFAHRHSRTCPEELLTALGPENGSSPGRAVDQELFYNWYEGNLSRFELTRLYDMTMDGVDRTLARVARSYHDGRHFGLVRWLLELGDDGDIIWLLSKGMTAADVGRKVQRNQWVVYKRRDAVLRRCAALGLTGDEGRAFCARLFGPQSEGARPPSDAGNASRMSPRRAEDVPPVRRDWAAELEAQAAPG